jgi:hypothetical protein
MSSSKPPKSEITLQQAYALIDSAEAVIVDGTTLTFPELVAPDGDPDNVWLTLRIDDVDDSDSAEVEFDQHAFRAKPCINRGRIVLEDTRGVLFEITLLDVRKF